MTTDREQAIATLAEHLNHWKRLLSEGVCTKDEGERTIKALTFAIESIKALDEIVGKIHDLTDTIVVNPENVLQRKTYVKYTDVINIIDYYRKEQE